MEEKSLHDDMSVGSISDIVGNLGISGQYSDSSIDSNVYCICCLCKHAHYWGTFRVNFHSFSNARHCVDGLRDSHTDSNSTLNASRCRWTDHWHIGLLNGSLSYYPGLDLQGCERWRSLQRSAFTRPIVYVWLANANVANWKKKKRW